MGKLHCTYINIVSGLPMEITNQLFTVSGQRSVARHVGEPILHWCTCGLKQKKKQLDFAEIREVHSSEIAVLSCACACGPECPYR